jgi:maltose O-acetyltransferase
MTAPDPARGERDKMLAGELYRANDPSLVAGLRRARRLTRLYNQTEEEEKERRAQLLAELFARVGHDVDIQPPFYCDYGDNISVGSHVFLNFGCVFLDCNRIEIGDGVQMGPGVHLYAATHPTEPGLRAAGLEMARPVRVGNNVWVGGGAILCPGVTVGDNSVLGAGSVVVRDVPANVVAAGNPCRVLRRLGG